MIKQYEDYVSLNIFHVFNILRGNFKRLSVYLCVRGEGRG